MRLLPLDMGRIDMDLRIVTGEDGSAELPVTSWLIEHPQGLVLFDNGMHVGLQHDTSRLGRALTFLELHLDPGDEVAARLTERDIRPTDVDVMVLSHLHFDHAGGTGEIPEARLVVNRAEWQAGQDPALIEAGIYDPVDYDHGHEVQEVEDGHDIFGDGRLVCIATPGHTAGHQALRVELDSGPVVLTGDCVYFRRMLDDMLVPRLGFDADEQRSSMRRLAAMRDEGCHLLYGHDAEQLATLPRDGLI